MRTAIGVRKSKHCLATSERDARGLLNEHEPAPPLVERNCPNRRLELWKIAHAGIRKSHLKPGEDYCVLRDGPDDVVESQSMLYTQRLQKGLRLRRVVEENTNHD